LLVARVVQGFAGGLIYGTSPALAVAGAPAALRGRRLGFLSGAMGLGFLGSLPAGALVESVGWRAVFHVRVPLALIVLVWAFATRSEAVELERKPMLLGDVTRGPVLQAGVLSFVARGGIFAIWLLVPFYLVEARGLGALVGGIFFMLPNMATIMAAFPPGRQGAAGGLSFLARTLGVVAGVAVMGQIVAARSAAVGFLGAFAESLVVAAVAVAVACAFALVGARARR